MPDLRLGAVPGGSSDLKAYLAEPAGAGPWPGVVAVHEAIDVPVKFIGVGEKATDLEPFDARTFSAELLAG